MVRFIQRLMGDRMTGALVCFTGFFLLLQESLPPALGGLEYILIPLLALSALAIPARFVVLLCAKADKPAKPQNPIVAKINAGGLDGICAVMILLVVYGKLVSGDGTLSRSIYAIAGILFLAVPGVLFSKSKTA